MSKIHFIGIGGIGMSALAQLLKERGWQVSGSDREHSPVTELLERTGIPVMVPQKAENVPSGIAIAVYSDAVAQDNQERARAREAGAEELSYFEMLGRVTHETKHVVAVAGTHGKTTTTGMVTKLLADAGANPTAVIGSIIRDFGPNRVEDAVGRTDGHTPSVLGSNYRSGDPDLLVVEACEYRDHLLKLRYDTLVVTNLEWDHTDWFPSLAAAQETFRKAIELVPETGVVVTDPKNPNIAPLLAGAKARVIDYTQEPARDLQLPGEFNVQNARAAAAAARALAPELSELQISESLAQFRGAWRRFEYKGKTARGAYVYDDYAHHPTAIKETLHALRRKISGKVFVAFHPHLYSRTKDLFTDFASSFTEADEIFIAPIYAAREVDDGTVSSEKLAEAIRQTGAHARAATFKEIEHAFATEAGEGDAVMTMGAGDIYKVADNLTHV